MQGKSNNLMNIATRFPGLSNYDRRKNHFPLLMKITGRQKNI